MRDFDYQGVARPLANASKRSAAIANEQKPLKRKRGRPSKSSALNIPIAKSTTLNLSTQTKYTLDLPTGQTVNLNSLENYSAVKIMSVAQQELVVAMRDKLVKVTFSK